MVWLYLALAVVCYYILDWLLRIPLIGKYDERYVFITGCDTGFGNLLAKHLDSLGFHVFAGCFTEKGEDELKKVSSVRLKTLTLDVSKTESIQKARENVEVLLPKDKGLWAVVNNAGIGGCPGLSEWQTREDYHICHAVNLYGLIDVCRIFLPLLRKGKGRIVNTSSVAGRLGAGPGPYVTSKFGVEGFSDCLRRELLKQGVSVHIVEPTIFRTPIIEVEPAVSRMKTAFDRLPAEIQDYYGHDFCDKVKPRMQEFLKMSSSKLHLVVDVYTHAITAMFPRKRYLVGRYKNFFRLLVNLPEWISDRMIASTAVTPAGGK